MVPMTALNLVNVGTVELALQKYARWALHPAVESWVLTVARNRIVARCNEKDFRENYVAWKPGCALHAPAASDLPDWAKTAVMQNREIHWFVVEGGLANRTFWKCLATVVEWMNSFPENDRRLGRLSRICFDEAVGSSSLWRNDLDANIWAYVKDRTKTILHYENDWKWVLLKSPLQFEREGKLMGHCIGNGSYFDNFKNKTRRYFSLRDPNNNPHVTIEAGETQLIQCKGRSNTKPIAEYQPYVTDFIEAMGLVVVGDKDHVTNACPTNISRRSEHIAR